MPSRLIRDGILESERVNQLSAEAEVFYRRLMSVVDDWGRYYAKPKLLRAAAYPLRLDTVGDADIGRWAEECVNANLIRLYQAGGAQFLVVLDFRQQVRAKKSKFPDPPEMLDTCAADAQHMQGTAQAGATHVCTKTKSKTKSNQDGGSLRSPPSPQGDLVGGVEHLPPTNPSDVSKNTKPPSAAAFDAYAQAYSARYGVIPPASAKTRGQFANLVTRIPAEEAPDVAAFYVTHSRRLYVEAGHPVDLLLRDCEKLRTEWRTGRTITATAAAQADRTQATAAAFAGVLAEAEAAHNALFPPLSLEEEAHAP